MALVLMFVFGAGSQISVCRAEPSRVVREVADGWRVARMTSDLGGGLTGAGRQVPPSERTAPLPKVPPGLIRYIDARMSRPSMVRPAVRRQRLIDQLDVAVQKPVTLVCA